MGIGNFGLGCCNRCDNPCDCEGWLPDGMNLHVVGRTQSPHFGLPANMAALCSHNTTSRLHRNVDFQTQRNVTFGSDFYSKRLIFDYPSKAGQQAWLGCLTSRGGSPTGWGRAGHRYWDCSNPGQVIGHPLRQQFTPSIFDKGETTHVMTKGDTNFPPPFPYLDRGNLLYVPEIHGAVFTLARNSKLNFRHKDRTFSQCNWWQEWPFCGWCIRLDLRFNSQVLTTWVPILVATSSTVGRYAQSDASSGTAPGFRPFSFVPATGTTNFLPGSPISFFLRTDAIIEVGSVNRIEFKFDYFEFNRNPLWTNVVRASGLLNAQLPSVCADNLSFPYEVSVITFNPFSVTNHACNLVMSYELF